MVVHDKVSKAPRMVLIPLAALLILLQVTPASAYSTRVHLWFANQIRADLMASGDGTIPLRLSDAIVQLDPEDVAVIIAEPEAFRAGAIGPDNTFFPAMTDGTHALGLNPYEQCEILYNDAILAAERAYALGCFLHGATDAVAHHYVNTMTGETFTLNPISDNREQGFGNVVRHIVAETQIQEALVAADPEGFDEEADLVHTIPVGFVMRNYFDLDAPMYAVVGAHALESFDAAVGDLAGDPIAALSSLSTLSELAPVEHLILIPKYIDTFELARQSYTAKLAARLAQMQDSGTEDGAKLLVGPGDDGVMGTYDDDTDCSVLCPALYAEYFVHVGLLSERYDAWGDPLESAFDLISGRLSKEIQSFPLALLQSVENLSQVINSPTAVGQSDGLGFTPEALVLLIAPMTDWAERVTTIDYKSLAYSVTPSFIKKIDSLLSVIGLDVSSILETLLDPLLDPIRQLLKQYVIQAATAFITELIEELEGNQATVLAEYGDRLTAAMPAGQQGIFLDHWGTSGLMAHSFNLTVATFANHEVLLPLDGSLDHGPASFDCSYTPEWSQAGLCKHLRDPIFPLGLGMQGLTSFTLGGEVQLSQMTDDAPIECHDGVLSSFGDPTVETCQPVPLDELLEAGTPAGSVSRAYPPQYAEDPPECVGVVVPGLPEPIIASPTVVSPATPSVPAKNTPELPAPSADKLPLDQGCAGGGDSTPFWVWSLLAGLWFVTRRQRQRPKPLRNVGVVGLVVVLPLWTACDDGAYAISAEQHLSATSPTGQQPAHEEGSAPGELDFELQPRQSANDGPLFAALGNSVWHGVQARVEDGEFVSRAVEMHFRADEQAWVEIRNPWGPARLMRFRGFTSDDDLTVESVVIQQSGWDFDPRNGDHEVYAFVISPGSPRMLTICSPEACEDYVEGPMASPSTGLTAVIRAFSAGPIEDAFCSSGLLPIDRELLLDYARLGTSEADFGFDAVAGAHLMSWYDTTENNQFAVTNVNGFERYGGTELQNQFNFIVWYEGTFTHPGGEVSIREEDDKVEDLVWALVGDDVGSNDPDDIFLEVHGFPTPDATSDEPSRTLPAGVHPIEFIIIRCANSIATVKLEMKFGGGAWERAGQVPMSPTLNEDLFPQAFVQ